NIFAQPFERGFVVDLERNVVTAGYIGFMEDDAVMVLLIPGFQVDAALIISIGFDEPDNLGVMFQGCIHIQHPERTMSRAHNTCNRHISLLTIQTDFFSCGRAQRSANRWSAKYNKRVPFPAPDLQGSHEPGS